MFSKDLQILSVYFVFGLLRNYCVHGGENGTIICGRTQEMLAECFKDLSPQLMEFLHTTKIAVNEKDIKSKCTVFRKGMSCFDKYTQTCLAEEKISLFRNNVSGARKFLTKFCEDRRFQADYLRHKECFLHIQEDWRKCTKNFQHILVDELQGPSSNSNISSKFMQFCCSRHAYENCIYNSARYKCYANSAKFVKDTARMLSDEKQFSNCRQYENMLCGRASWCGENLNIYFSLIAFLLQRFVY